MNNKKSYLDNLHYNIDNQKGNLELTYAYKNNEGTPIFSKWKKYLDCDDNFILKVNNRTILPNEVVLDIEEPERFKEIFEQVKKNFEFYSAWKTGSRGNHIHLFFDKDLIPEEKLSIIKKYKTDEQKASSRCLIALEEVPHWKTGKSKTLIEEKKGINKKPENEYIKILKNPNLLEMINEEFAKKVVGEEESRKVIFMVSNMRNVANLNKGSDNLIVNAISGTGKDHLTTAIFDIIPDEEKEELIRTTPKVLAYTRNKTIDENVSWKKTTLRMEDVSSNVLNDDSFKVISSSDPNGLNIGKTLIRQKVVEIIIEGKPSMILTIANYNVRDEGLRRFPTIFLNEGINQTKEILKRQSKYAMRGIPLEYNSDIKQSLRFLKRVKVKILYADKLVSIFENSTQNVIVRTTFPRFLDYIKSSASLFQYQRKTDSEGYIIADEKDYEIGSLCLKKTTNNLFMIPLSKLDKSIHNFFKIKKLKMVSVDELLDFDKIQKLGKSDRWIRFRLDFLVSKGFLERDSVKEEHSFKPIVKYSFKEVGDFLIPKFEELFKNTSNSSNTSNNTNNTNTSNSKKEGVFEVNEVFETITNKQDLDSQIKEMEKSI